MCWQKANSSIVTYKWEKCTVQTVFLALHRRRQFNEWKEINVFEMNHFLRLRSHVVSSRPRVSHQTEQTIHGGWPVTMEATCRHWRESDTRFISICLDISQEVRVCLHSPVLSNQHFMRLSWFNLEQLKTLISIFGTMISEWYLTEYFMLRLFNDASSAADVMFPWMAEW